MSSAAQRPSSYAYVGSRTGRARGGRGEGLTVYRIDRVSGALEAVQVLADVDNPSFLVLNRRRDRLYTVHGDGEQVSVFEVEKEGAQLHFLQSQTCGGRNPVHLALAPDGTHLVVSNHAGKDGAAGNIAIMPVDTEGRLSLPSQVLELPGAAGPHRIEQPYSRPHAAVFSPDGCFLLTMDKGQDRVFSFCDLQGRLVAAAQPWLDTREGAGPRLAVFHPNAPFVYIIDDLDSTVLACAFDAATGALGALQVVSTLSEDFTGDSRAASLAIAPNGRHLYASNRGEDSIAVLGVEVGTGRLSRRPSTASQGRTPRFIALDPAGAWLYALNEASDSITTFRVIGATGQLDAAGSVACRSPICMAFVA